MLKCVTLATVTKSFKKLPTAILELSPGITRESAIQLSDLRAEEDFSDHFTFQTFHSPAGQALANYPLPAGR